jgi:hypothetical protein
MRNSITLALPLLLAFGACGDSGGGDGGGESKNSLPASSGVTATEKVSALSDADLQKLCAYAIKRYDGLDKTKSCEAAAAFLTKDKQSCKAFAQLCESGTQPKNDCSKLTMQMVSSCDETVSAVEDCLKEDAESAADFTNMVSCDDAGKVQMPDQTDACAQVLSKCSAVEGQEPKN